MSPSAETRQQWGRRIEFFLTCVGYSVGVGDLWRFPYLVMKNGGGAFLIPIIVFNIVGAMPIVYMEMIMGQYSQSGAIPVWNVCPLLKGVGYGTVVSTFFFSIYYAIIICWMFYYFIHSFFPELPWNTCDNAWNVKETCVARTADVSIGNGNEELLDNITTTATSFSTVTSAVSTFSTAVIPNATTSGLSKLTSSEQFWRYKVLDLSEGLETLGSVNWPILGCLAFIEIVCFLFIFKGVKISGKAVYFTVLGPFVMLAVFLVRGAILPGADIGVKFYLTPDLEKLKDPKIWAEACMQVFTSIGPGCGGMITFASYNKFSNNCMRDAIFVCLLDLFTGIFGGFVIFSVLGHVSWRTGIDIRNFNQSGYGLGFVAYPEAANYLPPPQLWCVLFFTMSFFLGIDSQFPNYEIVVTALRDEFPQLLRKKHILLTSVVIVAAFLLAIPMVTQGGFYLLTLVDWYAATFSIAIFALIELIVMTYVYGVKRVDKNMREMTGNGVPIVFKVAWYAVTPVLLAITLTVYTYTPPAIGTYVYPSWAVSLGWCIAVASIAPIPLYVVYMLYKTPGSVIERFRNTLRPNDKWGPQQNAEDATSIESKQPLDANGVTIACINAYGTNLPKFANGYDNIVCSTRL